MLKKIYNRCMSILFVFILIITVVPSNIAFAATTSPTSVSCWGYAYTGVTVYNASKSKIGSLYAGEGFTILEFDEFSDGTPNYRIEYSTSNGPKYGYVLSSKVEVDPFNSTGAVVLSSTDVWYGRDKSKYSTIGSVNKGENVCVLAESGTWSYIEYNTNSGRKRGWCASSKIKKKGTQYSYIGSIPLYKEYEVEKNKSYSKRNVYAGPGSAYVEVGSIGTASKNETVYVIAEYSMKSGKWALITYHSTVTGKEKSGYIKI